MKNKSGEVRVQVIARNQGKYIVVRTLDSASFEQETATRVYEGKNEVSKLQAQLGLFIFEDDALIKSSIQGWRRSPMRSNARKE